MEDLKIFSTPSWASAKMDSIAGRVDVVLAFMSKLIRFSKLVETPNCCGLSVDVYERFMSVIMVINSSRSAL